MIFLSVFVLIKNSGISSDFFILSKSDWLYIIILASVCTAYAFIAAVDVMKNISPFTVILSYNLEPVYGIILAVLLFPGKERMSTEFYIGAILILIVVVFDALVKQKRAKGLKG